MASPTPARTLLAVPNISEGRNLSAIQELTEAFTTGPVALLDSHSDADHNRSVLSLAGPPGALADALLNGARETVARVDVMSGTADPPGAHPHVGALDVAPIVHLDERTRGAACAEALVLADRIGGELGVPVFLYGPLADGIPGRTRAELRRGGPAGLAERMRAGACCPDFGPSQMHPTAGATLVAARPPLVAFNLELAAPATVERARAIAARIRDGGPDGLPGVRAIGVALAGGRAQVSTNVERPSQTPLRAVVDAVGRHAPVARAELVGLAPRAALDGFPDDLAMPGFDPARQVIENAIGL